MSLYPTNAAIWTVPSFDRIHPGDLPEYPRRPDTAPLPELKLPVQTGGGFVEGLGHVARIAASIADIIRAQKGLPAGPYMYGPGGYRFGGEGLGRFFGGGYGSQRQPYNPDLDTAGRRLGEAPFKDGPKVVGQDLTGLVTTAKSEADELKERLAEILPGYQSKAFEMKPDYIKRAYTGESLF